MTDPTDAQILALANFASGQRITLAQIAELEQIGLIKSIPAVTSKGMVALEEADKMPREWGYDD